MHLAQSPSTNQCLGEEYEVSLGLELDNSAPTGAQELVPLLQKPELLIWKSSKVPCHEIPNDPHQMELQLCDTQDSNIHAVFTEDIALRQVLDVQRHKGHFVVGRTLCLTKFKMMSTRDTPSGKHYETPRPVIVKSLPKKKAPGAKQSKLTKLGFYKKKSHKKKTAGL